MNKIIRTIQTSNKKPNKMITTKITSTQPISKVPTRVQMHFTKETPVIDIAKQFKTSTKCFIDWEQGLPKDNEEGSYILKKILNPYTEYFQGLKQEDASRFSHFAIGKHQAKAIIDGANNNKDVKMFKNALEKALGQNLDTMI